MRCSTIPVRSIVITLSLSGFGCGLVCDRFSTVSCPDGASVGESVEAILTLSGCEDISFEWSVSGEVELSGETTGTLEIIPLSAGTIIVTLTATDETTGDTASGSCTFEAVENDDEERN